MNAGIIQCAQEDLIQLVEIAKAAFLEDDHYKPVGADISGPPGHDQLETHTEWFKEVIYLKIVADTEIAGGICYDVKDSIGEITALFVHPDFMNKGLASEALNCVFKKERTVTRWWLETPDYAKRNHTFYRKNGFKLTKHTQIDSDLGFGFHIYEKTNV